MNFRVEGMTCGHCERAVTRAVQSIDPAARVTVDRTADRVVVESVADADAVVRAIQAEGYVVDRSAQPCDSGTCSTRRREDERKSAVRSRTARDTPPGYASLNRELPPLFRNLRGRRRFISQKSGL